MGRELRKILFVDDDQDVHMIVKLCLREIPNLEFRSAFSGQEAISISQEFLPDLILLDVMMPKMDGIETLRALKQIPSLKNTAVVFLTAKAVRSEVENFLKYGVVEVITKPFDALTLSKEVLEIWNRINNKE